LFKRKIVWSILLAAEGIAAPPDFGLETPLDATLSAASLAPFALGAPGSTVVSAIAGLREMCKREVDFLGAGGSVVVRYGCLIVG